MCRDGPEKNGGHNKSAQMTRSKCIRAKKKKKKKVVTVAKEVSHGGRVNNLSHTRHIIAHNYCT